jgi:hypothetical protein
LPLASKTQARAAALYSAERRFSMLSTPWIAPVGSPRGLFSSGSA